MRIIPSSDSNDPIVGREYVNEEPEGEFVLAPGGGIVYRHPAVGEMPANSSKSTFVECVRAWEDYLARAATVQGEDNQLRVVEGLRKALASQNALVEGGFWENIVQQAEWGHL